MGIDMLVKLYELPELCCVPGKCEPGISVRKTIGPEKHLVIDWVRRNFGGAWASEVDVALCNRPSTCWIAVKKEPSPQIVGFVAYDATALGFLGPMGVASDYRKRHIGRELLLTALWEMKTIGYGYSVIGHVGAATPFYSKVVGAREIEGSDSSVWATWVGAAQ